MALPSATVAQVKHSLRAPILERIARTADTDATRWLDTWFSAPAQARLRAVVAKLR